MIYFSLFFQIDLTDEYLGRGSSSPSDSSSPPTPSSTPTPSPMGGINQGAGAAGLAHGLPMQLPHGLVLTPSLPGMFKIF